MVTGQEEGAERVPGGGRQGVPLASSLEMEAECEERPH